MEELLTIRNRVREAICAIPAVADVLDGSPSADLYRWYLLNVWHYAQHSPSVIAKAGARCVESNPELASYLFHHADEELGHEWWALEDLADMGIIAEEVRASRPVPACAAMIGFEYFTAEHANPVGLFGWLYLLEAIGEDLGGVVTRQLRSGLDLDDGVRFVEGHGVADVVHTADLTRQITENIRNEDMDAVIHTAEVMGDIYVRMFEQIAKAAGV